MNWAAIASAIAAITLLVTLAGIALIAGQFKQQVMDLKDCTNEHDLRLKAHDDRISENKIAIVRLESWKDGFQAAAHTVRRSEGS